MDVELKADIESTLGVTIHSDGPAPRGDINQSAKLISDQGILFLKVNAPDRLDMFSAEADGLREIAASNTIRVPRPLGHGCANHSWLAMDWLELVPADARSQTLLGQQLAQMHRVTGKAFGWYRDNTIGTTPQPNPWCDDWITFFGQHRLRHQFDLLAPTDPGWRHLHAQLVERLDAFYDSYRPEPSLLHGDLWGGNQGALKDGVPVIYDPACWYGDREADIAMTELFGGFGSEFYHAYNRQWPLDPGYERRKPLHQLYHVLNHANLFGGGYISRARELTRNLVTAIL